MSLEIRSTANVRQPTYDLESTIIPTISTPMM